MVYNFFNYLRGRSSSKRLPFSHKAGHLKRQSSLDGELYGSVITLKNLALVQKEKPLSADYIFEALLENSMTLRPAYEELITLYRGGRDEEAFRTFAERVGSRAGRSFASVLSKLDRINPSETVKQMEVLQNMMAERMTAAVRTAQRNSVLVTAWASASIFALLINFAVVVVFMDTLGMLGHLF